MPRKDPVTGCEVMTLPEFWADEAKIEGKGRNGSDLMQDFYDQLRQADEEDAEVILQNPDQAWIEICEACNLSSVDIVQSWEAWMDEQEEYERDRKDGFKTARKNLHENLRRHFKTLKSYAAYRKDLHERLYEGDPKISKGEPHPVAILRMLTASSHSGMRSGGRQWEALVLCADGKKRVFCMSSWSDSGSMMEPPDGGWDFTWREPKSEELD